MIDIVEAHCNCTLLIAGYWMLLYTHVCTYVAETITTDFRTAKTYTCSSLSFIPSPPLSLSSPVPPFMTSSAQPPVVVLCVNSQEVDNVAQMFAFIASKALAHERFKCVKSYAGMEEDTPVQLLNGCDFFMVTPSSLLRLLKKKQVTFGSLDHLVRQRTCCASSVSLQRHLQHCPGHS